MYVVAWLSNRRPSNPFVGALVSPIERLKYEFFLKLSIRYIPSEHNVSADLLSRLTIPARQQKNGNRIYPNLRRICATLLIENIYHICDNDPNIILSYTGVTSACLRYGQLYANEHLAKTVIYFSNNAWAASTTRTYKTGRRRWTSFIASFLSIPHYPFVA